MGVGAGGWAGGSAGVENLVFTALVWWQHHERGGQDVWALLFRHATTISVTEVSLLAGAARDADAWADGVGFRAGAIATFALTIFFVVTADASWGQGHGFGSRNTALDGWDALALFVFQMAGFAEATNNALTRADGARVGVGAGRCAGRSARHEDLVFLALRHFRRVGEEHGGLDGCAVGLSHAGTLGVTQVTSLAEASDDALFGAESAGFGVGAVGGACGAA